MTYFYEADTVRQAARGGWLSILEQLAPALGDAIDAAPRHVDCPFIGHGGKKDFRLFDDAAETGGGICTCGTSHDGFELLMKINGWSFKDALQEVGDLVRAERKEKKSKRKPFKAEKKSTESIAANAVNDVDNSGREARRSVKGRLLESGTAPYRFDEKESSSFFVKVEVRTGVESVLWSVDLERALKEANALSGDIVVLKLFEKQPITIQMPTKKGSEPKEKTVYKNIWECQNLTPRDTSQDEFDDESHDYIVDKPKKHKKAKAAKSNPDADAAQAAEDPQWLKEAKEKAAIRETKRKEQDAKTKDSHNKLWNQCISIHSELASPVFSYLRSRGITQRLQAISNDDVRFHTGLAYYEENDEKHYEKIGVFPAIVAAIRSPEGEILSLHRTYLHPEGKKAEVENPRKMMPVPKDVSLGGGAIRLGEPKDGVLGIAEGLETALAASKGSGISCWSTVSANILSQFEPPANVHTVVVFADKDRSNTGAVAAEQLRVKLESQGVKVKVLLPMHVIPEGQKSIDWNDVLEKHGMLGFPPRSMINSIISA